MAEVTREELAEALKDTEKMWYHYDFDEQYIICEACGANVDMELGLPHLKHNSGCSVVQSIELLSRLDAEQNGGGE